MFCLLPFSTVSTISQTAIPATGANAISADSIGGAYTSLTGPVYVEASEGNVGVGTIILNAPAGYNFDTGGTAPLVRVNRLGGSGGVRKNINDLPEGGTIAVTRADTNLSITITAASSNAFCQLTWENIRVRPTAGTPLASGNITKSGTAIVAGVVNGATSFGTLTEIAGLPAQLAIGSQPSASATAGVPFQTQPVIRILDQFGNLRTLDNSSAVTVARSAGTGVLQGTLTATASAGVATFVGLNHPVANSITLLFASAALPPVSSASIEIVAAAADRLIFLNQPGSALEDSPFGVQPLLQTQDQFGNHSVSIFSEIPSIG